MNDRTLSMTAKLKGDQFSQKEFLQKRVSFGAVPLRTLKTKILQ